MTPAKAATASTQAAIAPMEAVTAFAKIMIATAKTAEVPVS